MRPGEGLLLFCCQTMHTRLGAEVSTSGTYRARTDGLCAGCSAGIIGGRFQSAAMIWAQLADLTAALQSGKQEFQFEGAMLPPPCARLRKFLSVPLQAIKREILGEDSEDEEGPEGSGDEEEEDDEDLEETERQQEAQQAIQVGA